MCTSDVSLKNLPKEKKKLKLHNNLPELISLQPRLCSRPIRFVANNKELVQEQQEDAKIPEEKQPRAVGNRVGTQNTKAKNGKEETEEKEEETSDKNCY
jgi:hypothetical protein